MDKAQKGEHSKFEYIRCFRHYFAVLRMQSALKKVIKTFEEGVVKGSKLYASQVLIDKQDFNLLLSITKFDFVAEYYLKEYEILEDMKNEYKAFLEDNNWFKSFLGYYREDFQCWDYRTRRK